MKKIVLLFLSLISFNETSNAQFTKLFDFERDTTGGYPYEALISDGTYLYGLAHLGGTNDGGTLFKIKPDGSDFTKLFDFIDSTSGNFPNGSLFYDGTFLYGMTNQGGTYDKGTIFKIKTDGSGYVKLFDFNGINGWGPFGSLISDGTFLYGVTYIGGTNGDGTVFKIKYDGSGFLILMNFDCYTTTGCSPHGSLIYDGAYLFGMTMGGIGGGGTIFKIKTDGSGYVKLLDFIGTNGSSPYGSLISDGTYLYGMTRQGGTHLQGNIFKIKTDGSGFLDIFDFNGNTNGSCPEGSLVFAGSYLYGMTLEGGFSNYGTIFKIKSDGSDFVELWDFINTTDGRYPSGTLFFDSIFLYGMTYSGGSNNEGVIFKIDTTVIVGLKDIIKDDNFAVYPNPVRDNFTIVAPQKATIEILNIEGQVIKKVKVKENKTVIDISDFSSGVYIIRAQAGIGITTKKFIKE